jgi:hypothetical protein
MGYNQQPQQKINWYYLDDDRGVKIKCKDCDRAGPDNIPCNRPIFYDTFSRTYIDFYERNSDRNYHSNFCLSNPNRLSSPNTPKQSPPTFRGAPNPNNYTGSSADYENRQSPPQQPQQQGYQQPPPSQTNNATLNDIMRRLDISDNNDAIIIDRLNKQNEIIQYIYDELIVQIPKLTLAFDNLARDNPAYRAVLEFQARMFPVFNKYLLKTDDEKAGITTADKLQEIRTSNKENDERYDKYASDPGLADAEFHEEGGDRIL